MRPQLLKWKPRRAAAAAAGVDSNAGRAGAGSAATRAARDCGPGAAWPAGRRLRLRLRRQRRRGTRGCLRAGATPVWTGPATLSRLCSSDQGSKGVPRAFSFAGCRTDSDVRKGTLRWTRTARNWGRGEMGRGGDLNIFYNVFRLLNQKEHAPSLACSRVLHSYSTVEEFCRRAMSADDMCF